MTPEMASIPLPSLEKSPIQRRGQRIDFYMKRFNTMQEKDVKQELGQILAKREHPTLQLQLGTKKGVDSNSDSLLIRERDIDTMVENNIAAEDAMAALLCGLQTPTSANLRKNHIRYTSSTDLPKLVRLLEDTRLERELEDTGLGREDDQIFKDPYKDMMFSSKDQAVLYLIQVFFYDTARIDGKRPLFLSGKIEDEIEVEKLARKLNPYLPKKDQFIILRPVEVPQEGNYPKISPVEKKAPKKDERIQYPPTDERRKKLNEIKRKLNEIKMERKTKELQQELWRGQNHLHISPENPSNPADLAAPPSSFGADKVFKETFGAEGMKNEAAFFSFLSLISPDAQKQVADWLIRERSSPNQGDAIRQIATAGKQLFQEVLLDSDQDLSFAFAVEVNNNFNNPPQQNGEERTKTVHELFEEKATRLMGKEVVPQIREHIVEAAERLFLLQRATILGSEIQEEIRERRKAMVGDVFSDASSFVDKEEKRDLRTLLTKIQSQYEFPIAADASIMPYELNVRFPASNDARRLIPQLVAGGEEAILKEMMQMSRQQLQEVIVCLAIEKWSHQARRIKEVTDQFSSPDDKQKSGHILPWTVFKGRVKGKDTIKYTVHDFTLKDENNLDEGYLYIGSQTRLSVPVRVLPIGKRGDPLHLEYMGLDAFIPGKESTNPKRLRLIPYSIPHDDK